MKKKYLIVSLLQAFIIIASVLLLPVTAHSQDLTEEEKKERCQNNKNKLAELEKQSANVNAELRKIPEEKEIEDARGYMVFVRNIGNKAEYNFDEISDADLTKISRIARIYNVTPTDFQEAKRFGWLPSTKALYNVIVDKINKDEALLSQKPALLKQKADIDKQIATHRNNLVALGCDAPKKDDGSFDSKLSGYWELELGSPYGGTTQLTVANGGVSGSSQRSATAVIKITGGSFDPATKRLSFTYIQQWSQRTGKASFEFRESSANYVLTGIWRDDVSGSGNWVMTKKKQ